MKYDFTSIIDRHGRDSIAVDGLKGDGFSPAPSERRLRCHPDVGSRHELSYCTYHTAGDHRTGQSPGLRLLRSPAGIL